MNGTCSIAWTGPKANTDTPIIYLQNKIDVTKPLPSYQEGLNNKSKRDYNSAYFLANFPQLISEKR